MSPRNLSSSHRSFLRRFCFIAVLASVLLLIISSYVSFKLYEGYVVRLAESNASNLAAAIVDARSKALNRALDLSLLEQDSTHLLVLDKDLRAFVRPYSIVKIKLFEPSGVIVYSTDMGVVGRSSEDNKHLDIALEGGNSSTIQTKEQIHDLTNEERIDVDVVESYVPMRDDANKVIGVFEIYQDMTRFRDEVNSGVVSFVLGLSIILAAVFTLAFCFMKRSAKKMIAQQQKLEQLATIDPVTNIYNRAEITRLMEAEWERFSRVGNADNRFGLMMLDLDYFKKINDNYGHQIGDELLKRVVHRLQGELRIYSQLGRYGGEEFMVLLPNVHLEDLKGIADRVLKLIADKPFEIRKHQISITLSAGLAIAEPSDVNIDAIIKRADDHLYIAKESGRNCQSGA